MFKFKNRFNELLIKNFIDFNNDPGLNQGLIKKFYHEEHNWFEVDSTATDLKINFLYSKPILSEAEQKASLKIIEKYNQIKQNIIWVMLNEEETDLQKDQFQHLGLDFEVTYRAMLMKLQETPERIVEVPQGFTLKKLESQDLEKFKAQIDDGFGPGIIDTTKYATILKMNAEKEICNLILIYRGDEVVATGNVYYGPEACVIDDITVSSKARGQGLASVILYHLLNDARQRKCENLLLVATNDGFPIYEKMGFKETGLKLEIYETRN